MAALATILDDPARRAAFVTDGVALIEREVASKRGITGLALKTGFAALKRIRPGMVREALDGLLPAFAPALEQEVQAAIDSGDVAGHFRVGADRIAEAMLAVTDAKAQRAQNAVVKRTYAGLRSHAKHHTVAAMPGVGELVAAHVGSR